MENANFCILNEGLLLLLFIWGFLKIGFLFDKRWWSTFWI